MGKGTPDAKHNQINKQIFQYLLVFYVVVFFADSNFKREVVDIEVDGWYVIGSEHPINFSQHIGSKHKYEIVFNL